MLAALRPNIFGWKPLRLLRPMHSLLHFTSSSALTGDLHHHSDAMNSTKAVIFDMGGVLVQSPIPFLAGSQPSALCQLVQLSAARPVT